MSIPEMGGTSARGRREWRSAFTTIAALAALHLSALGPGDAGGGSQPSRPDGMRTDRAAIEIVPGGRPGEYRHGTYPSRGNRTHAGVDIVAPCGTPIRALEEGRIVDRIRSRSDPDFRSLGYMAIVEHPTWITGRVFYSLYLHLQSPPEPGERVARGDALGRVGATGRATGCHLHLEVRYFRGRVSPRWNHIYGPGDQRDSPYFQENWDDPLELIARLSGERRTADPRRPGQGVASNPS